MFKKLVLIFFLILLFSYSYADSSLNSIIPYIKQFARHDQQNSLNLLETLVNINSGTENANGVYEIGKILEAQFQALGFNTYWVEEPKNMHHAGTLIAERKGNRGKKILLIGHLDTVFPSNSPFREFKKSGNLAKGPGVIDDKGGDVVILSTLKALQAIHGLDNTSITIALTGDEENSGKPTSISRKALKTAAIGALVALDFEPAASLNSATIARRGVCHWQITTYGKDLHSSQIFKSGVGDGAIFEMARILNSIRSDMATEKYLTFNPGISIGGNLLTYNEIQGQGTVVGKDNIIASKNVATGDLRFFTDNQKLQAEKMIQNIISQHLPDTNGQILFVDGPPGMPDSENNEKLLHQFSTLSEELGYGRITADDPLQRGAGDISYVASLVPANLGGLGPTGGGTHSQDEYLEIDSLSRMSARAALLIYSLTH